MWYFIADASVAQWIERLTSDQVVAGSSPARRAKHFFRSTVVLCWPEALLLAECLDRKRLPQIVPLSPWASAPRAAISRIDVYCLFFEMCFLSIL